MKAKDVREKAGNAKDFSKEGFVDFVTNPKIIQAFLTGSAFAIIQIGILVIANGVKGYGPHLPLIDITVRQLRFGMMVFVAAFWYWADNNQQRFEMMVQDATDSEEEKQEKIQSFNSDGDDGNN